VPTIAESGFPGYEGYLWIGAPRRAARRPRRGTSRPRSRRACRPRRGGRLRRRSDRRATPEEFGKLIAAELKRGAKVVAEAGITAAD
jgi:hypothetical protein